MARDWPGIKAAYIAGVPAPDLAERFGVPVATIKSTASRERWGAARREVAERVAADLPGAIADALTEEAVDDAIMGRNEVLRRWTAIARGGMHQLAEWGPDGVTLKRSSELPAEVRALVSEVYVQVSKFGKAVRIKALDPLAALDKLGRYHGVFPEKEGGPGGAKGGDAPRGVIELPAFDPEPIPPADTEEDQNDRHP